jgi:hypothetical protein
LTDDLQAHPADVLAQQLDRVTGLVRIMGDLYSTHNDSFATGSSFIAHGLVAVSTLLSDAQGALDNLHQVCDLRLNTAQSSSTAEDSSVEAVATDAEPMVFPPVETEWHDAEHAETDAVAQVPNSPSTKVQSVQDDEFAQSYLELLRKLTAAEVFAAEQQALAPPGSGQNLLPLLRSLREEFQKLHRVA